MPRRLRNWFNTKWGTYCYWVFWVGIAFFTIYPLCNWITSHRDVTFGLYLAAELRIPFVVELIWPYLSLYLLFLIPPLFLKQSSMAVLGKQLLAATVFCGIVFLILPAQLGFERTVPVDAFYAVLYGNIFAVDLPHNMVPSLHVAFSTLILLTLARHSRQVVAKTLFWTWLVLICLSTILVHQHHLLDVATGLLVAALFTNIIGKGEHHA